MQARLNPFVYDAQGLQVALGDPEVLYTREDDTALYARVTSQDSQVVPQGTPADYYTAPLLIRGLPPCLVSAGLHGVIRRARQWVLASMTISEDRQVLASTSIDCSILSRLESDFEEALAKAEAEARAKAEAEAQAAEQQRLAKVEHAQERIAQIMASTEVKLQRVDDLQASIESDIEARRQLEQEIILLGGISAPANRASENTKEESGYASSVNAPQVENTKKRKASSPIPGHVEWQRVKREAGQDTARQPKKPRAIIATSGPTYFDLTRDSDNERSVPKRTDFLKRSVIEISSESGSDAEDEDEAEPSGSSSGAVAATAKRVQSSAAMSRSVSRKSTGGTVRQNHGETRCEAKTNEGHSNAMQNVEPSGAPGLPAVLVDLVTAGNRAGPPREVAGRVNNFADYASAMEVSGQMDPSTAVQSMPDSREQRIDKQDVPSRSHESNALESTPYQSDLNSALPSLPEQGNQNNAVSSPVDAQMPGIDATHNDTESQDEFRDGKDTESSDSGDYETSYHSETSSDYCTEDGHSAYHQESSSDDEMDSGSEGSREDGAQGSDHVKMTRSARQNGDADPLVALPMSSVRLTSEDITAAREVKKLRKAFTGLWRIKAAGQRDPAPECWLAIGKLLNDEKDALQDHPYHPWAWAGRVKFESIVGNLYAVARKPEPGTSVLQLTFMWYATTMEAAFDKASFDRLWSRTGLQARGRLEVTFDGMNLSGQLKRPGMVAVAIEAGANREAFDGHALTRGWWPFAQATWHEDRPNKHQSFRL